MNIAVSNSLGRFRGQQTRLSPGWQMRPLRLSLSKVATCPLLVRNTMVDSQRQTRPTRERSSVCHVTDAVQSAPAPHSAVIDTSVGRSTDAAQHPSLLRTEAALANWSTEADVSVRRSTTAASDACQTTEHWATDANASVCRVSVRASVASSSTDHAWGKPIDAEPAFVASATNVCRLQNNDDHLHNFATSSRFRRKGK
jgi:hypothetical protein